MTANYPRSNEQLQNTVNEQSDRIRDFVYRQMRDTELINELKNDVRISMFLVMSSSNHYLLVCNSLQHIFRLLNPDNQQDTQKGK